MTTSFVGRLRSSIRILELPWLGFSEVKHVQQEISRRSAFYSFIALTDGHNISLTIVGPTHNCTVRYMVQKDIFVL
jgi:hypothetical protein